MMYTVTDDKTRLMTKTSTNDKMTSAQTPYKHTTRLPLTIKINVER